MEIWNGNRHFLLMFSATQTESIASSARGSSRARRTRKKNRCFRVVQAQSEEEKAPLSSLNSAIELRSKLQEVALVAQNSPQNNWIDIFGDQTAYVYEPKSKSTTWGFVHFLGGAVLGQFPQVCYDQFLSSVSEETGVTVICTPFELGTKHGTMAKRCRSAFEKARGVVQERNGLDGENVPIFYVGHSLGAKLHAVANFEEEEGNNSNSKNSNSTQHFLVAFNNASATDSVKILEKFAKELLNKREGGGDAASSQFEAIFDRLVPFAEVAAKAAGLEFAPNAIETLDGVANGKFKSDKVTLLSFTNDELDQCSSLREALADGGVRTNTVEIPGDHLSPVLLDLDKYAKMNPMMNRLSGVRIGDGEAVQKIASEMVKFLKS